MSYQVVLSSHIRACQRIKFIYIYFDLLIICLILPFIAPSLLIFTFFTNIHLLQIITIPSIYQFQVDVQHNPLPYTLESLELETKSSYSIFQLKKTVRFELNNICMFQLYPFAYNQPSLVSLESLLLVKTYTINLNSFFFE